VRKLLIGLLLAAACRSHTAEIPPTSKEAGLAAFLGAVRSSDLQAMSGVWGDKNGPVRDSRKMSREDMERRELIMMCYFRHDKYRILGESPGPDSERIFQVELTKGTLRRTTNFYVTQGGDRWYVRFADMEPVKDLCADKK
jgi:hypothetical protein